MLKKFEYPNRNTKSQPRSQTRVTLYENNRSLLDVCLPKTDKPMPIVFSRTPYDFNSWGYG